MIENYCPPTDPYLNIVYHDDEILVLDKPSGLLSVPGKGPLLSDCLEKRACEKFDNARTVHRLDMDTSGLIILGLSKFSHRHLSLQFQNRNVGKKYIARIFETRRIFLGTKAWTPWCATRPTAGAAGTSPAPARSATRPATKRTALCRSCWARAPRCLKTAAGCGSASPRSV